MVSCLGDEPMILCTSEKPYTVPCRTMFKVWCTSGIPVNTVTCWANFEIRCTSSRLTYFLEKWILENRSTFVSKFLENLPQIASFCPWYAASYKWSEVFSNYKIITNQRTFNRSRTRYISIVTRCVCAINTCFLALFHLSTCIKVWFAGFWFHQFIKNYCFAYHIAEIIVRATLFIFRNTIKTIKTIKTINTIKTIQKDYKED